MKASELKTNLTLKEQEKLGLEYDEVTDNILRKRNIYTSSIPSFERYLIYFTPYQAASLIFNLPTYEQGNELIAKNFRSVQETLSQYVKGGLLKQSKVIMQHNDILGDIETVQIHRDDLTIFVGFFNIPDFKALPPLPDLTSNSLKEANNSDQQFNNTNTTITELKARIAELENQKQSEQQHVVNYDEYSIYGHTTPAIEAIFKTIKKFWVNADLSQPDTVSNVEEIEQWIKDNCDVSGTLRSAIQKIIRPEKARILGRKS